MSFSSPSLHHIHPGTFVHLHICVCLSFQSFLFLFFFSTTVTVLRGLRYHHISRRLDRIDVSGLSHDLFLFFLLPSLVQWFDTSVGWTMQSITSLYFPWLPLVHKVHKEQIEYKSRFGIHGQ